MARAGLGLGVVDLAKAARVSTNTITRLERGEVLGPRTLDAVREALERAGAVFIAEDGGGPGVRLRKSGRPVGRAARVRAPRPREPHPAGSQVGPGGRCRLTRKAGWRSGSAHERGGANLTRT